jgi:hypothetical protein
MVYKLPTAQRFTAVSSGAAVYSEAPENAIRGRFPDGFTDRQGSHFQKIDEKPENGCCNFGNWSYIESVRQTQANLEHGRRTMSRKFYSVTTMTTSDDDGIATTFGTLGEAIEYRRWAATQGLFYVSPIWS